MEAKAAEANQPAPSYDQTFPPPQQPQQQPQQPTFQQQNQQNITIEQNGRPATMFVTARTSVFGPNPVEMDCPHCQAHIVTHIDRIAGVLPWLIFGACVILGFFLFLIPWCFCCLPFFTDQCLDVLHSCPSCKRHLGRYSRM